MAVLRLTMSPKSNPTQGLRHCAGVLALNRSSLCCRLVGCHRQLQFWSHQMQRSIALLQLAKIAATLPAGDVSVASANRLLSNSQASTSSACSQLRNASSANDDTNGPRARARQPSDTQRDQRGARDGESSNPRTASHNRPFQQASDPTEEDWEPEDWEPEVGFVQDGPYPYSASEVKVVNTAGSTETAWDFLGSNDEDCITWFGVDFTRGKIPEVERNALLSDSTKEMMYQMHSHDKKRYSVEYLATLFEIRQQRVMAILALKGMEHQTVPLPDSLNAVKKQSPPSASADSAATEASDTQTDATSADAATESSTAEEDEGLDLRGQVVKASMEEAAKEVPAYLKSIKHEADSWQLESTVAETPAERKTDSNILMAWLRHLASDPFWLRPSKEDKQADAAAAAAATKAAAESAETPAKAPLTEKEQKAAAKEEQELEQQQLQDEVQSQQRDRGSAEGGAESSDPKTEGVQRYMLSNPNFLSHIMENDVFDCHEVSGTGERHVKYIPRYPNFEYFPDDRPEALAADKEAGGKANIERPVLDFWETACDQQAAEEEVHLVKEFKEKLQYNLQQTGSKLNRNSRFSNAPSRPKEGWSMVVQDVSNENSKKQYVATPSGKIRSLTADEQVYLDRMVPKKRKKIV